MNNMLRFPAPPRMAQPQGQQRQQNPMQMLVSQFMGGMSPMAILDQMGGPQAQQARQLIGGKNENQLREIAMNMARQRGVDLNQIARQWGVKLPE